MNFIRSIDILWTNFNLINNPPMFVYTLYWCSLSAWRRSR